MMIFNSFTVAMITILAHNARTGGGRVFLSTITVEGICLALLGKFCQKEFLLCI